MQVLDGIQDNYTFAQPGIQTKIRCCVQLNAYIVERIFAISDNIKTPNFKQAVRRTAEAGGSHPSHPHCQ